MQSGEPCALHADMGVGGPGRLRSDGMGRVTLTDRCQWVLVVDSHLRCPSDLHLGSNVVRASCSNSGAVCLCVYIACFRRAARDKFSLGATACLQCRRCWTTC